jgi:NAD(P)-dependent dehydrogenase (short-subunit alcohol dehydrogenase family)
VVVNDLGTADAVAAAVVPRSLPAAQALANQASVTDEAAVAAMVQQALDAWGRVDILVNNAGILRDKSFAKMELADFRLVLDVHLMGAVICSQAVWAAMRAQKYGRIVMTTSSSGLYGNFGQANYGAAKMALVGLMQTLSIEGAKDGIRVNCLAPTAATRMTEGLLPPPVLAADKPEAVTPGLLHLVSEDAPTRAILCAGAGTFERAHVTLTAACTWAPARHRRTRGRVAPAVLGQIALRRARVLADEAEHLALHVRDVVRAAAQRLVLQRAHLVHHAVHQVQHLVTCVAVRLVDIVI